MPDWSYQTVFRPLLFRLPAETARDWTLGLMGRLARWPLGPNLIDFLGHMAPPSSLSHRVLGISLASPVGLAAGLDVHAVAVQALARFGFGFLELGPVTAETIAANRPIERRPEQRALWYPEPPPTAGIDALVRRLARGDMPAVPLGARLGHAPGASADAAARERCRLIDALAPYVAFFSLEPTLEEHFAAWGAEGWRQHLGAVLRAAAELPMPRPVLLVVPPDAAPERIEARLGPGRAEGVHGVVVAGGIASAGGRLLGAPAREPALRQVRHLRARFGSDLAIVACGGVQEPADALALFEAGADLVALHSGLVYSGPGLPKRINEALEQAARPETAVVPNMRPAETSGFWLGLLGAGMLVGGALALVIAATRVVLPYDEGFVGLSRAQLAAANERLLAFLAHDRVSLAGTMLAIGILYIQLALHGMRRGLHWPKQTVLLSAFTGFASFFLFLAFGYFDPFHAFTTAVLLQLLLLGLHCGLPPRLPPAAADLHNDRDWRRAQWGQLLLVGHAAALMTAGLVITGYGVTVVFVPEDLQFMRTTAEALQGVSPRLLPMIAHDRAHFGGMLVAVGLGLLTVSLWGIRPGSAWLWWTLLAVALAGYGPALAVHLVVGYTDLWHLSPAILGLALNLAGLMLVRPFLCRQGPPAPKRAASTPAETGPE
jgi:dihydroorotate dehydrogenase